MNDPISDFTDMVPGGDSITLRMLMQHTSGVANYTQSTTYREAEIADPDHRFTYLAQRTGGGELSNGVAQAFGLATGGYGHGLVVASDDTLGVLLAGAGNGSGARTFVGYWPDHGVSFVVAVSAGDGSVPIVETLSATGPILDALREVLAEP